MGRLQCLGIESDSTIAPATLIEGLLFQALALKPHQCIFDSTFNSTMVGISYMHFAIFEPRSVSSAFELVVTRIRVVDCVH